MKTLRILPTSRQFRAIMLVALLILLALPILTYPLGGDQGEFAIIGREILAGKTPYVELWNPKPPAVFYFYSAAMALFGYTAQALRSIDLIIFPAIGLGLYSIGTRLGNRRVGLMAAAIYAAIYFRQSFWTLTQNDGIVILPMVLSVVCTFQALDARQHRYWAALSGALSAAVLWFKYPFVFFVLAIVISHALSVRRTVPNWQARLLADAIAFTTGGLIVGVGGILYLTALGAFDAWIESAFVTSSYTRQGFEDIFTSTVWRDSLEYWLTWPFPSILIGWPVVMLAVRRPGTGWHGIWLWLAGALAGLIAQAKGYDYHYLPMLPPLALLAADMIDRIGLWLHRRWPRHTIRQMVHTWIPAGVLAITLQLLLVDVWIPALPYITGQQDRIAYYSGFRGGSFTADESLAVVNYLQPRTTPRDSLYIWGFRPEVYYLADLRPPTRFIFQYPLVGDWYPPEWKEENVEILWAAMPPYVLVLQGDYIPWVTGRDEDSKTLLEEYTDLIHWLQYNYEEETQIGSFIVWRRIDR